MTLFYYRNIYTLCATFIQDIILCDDTKLHVEAVRCLVNVHVKLQNRGKMTS